MPAQNPLCLARLNRLCTSGLDGNQRIIQAPLSAPKNPLKAAS
jgi:hypothetical protein